MIIDPASPAERAELGRGPGRKRLEVTNARLRSLSGGDALMAGYATLVNETASPVTIVALESPAFARVEMREPAPEGEGMAPRRVDSLEILPGECLELAPEGRHLVLSGPRQVPEEGQLVGITVAFSSGRQRVIPFRLVIDAAPASARSPGQAVSKEGSWTTSVASHGADARRASGRAWSERWSSARPAPERHVGEVPGERVAMARQVRGGRRASEERPWWAWSGLLPAGENRAPGRA